MIGPANGGERGASLGPIWVSDSGRYFVGGDRQPFFWLGDTAWLIAHKARREDVDLYLETRASQGFTVIQAAAVMAEERIAGAVMAEERVAGVAAPNAYNARAFVEDDPGRPNTTPGSGPDSTAEYDYWDHLDYVLQSAEARGLIVGLVPLFVACGGQGYRYLTTANALPYGRFLGQRYRAHSNIIWILGGDNTPDTDEKQAVWHSLARGIAEGVVEAEESRRRLMTYHINGGRSSSQWFHNAPWLDFNMVQTWDAYDRIYPMLMADYNRSPVKPAGLGEGAYEDGPQYPTGPIDAWVIRKQAYWSYMAGGYHTYGNTNVWSFGTYASEATQGWQQALHSPGAMHLAHLRTLFTTMPWWKLVPDASILAEGAGSGRTLNVAMCSTDGDLAIVYLSSPSRVAVRMDRITASARVTVRWFDPTTGEETPIGNVPASGVRSFATPDGWEDAVLLLTA
jgi:Protein of unknown function (DUF4038)/Putative collagen-binding domain of a collagenase